MTDHALDVRNVEHHYGTTPSLRGVDLAVAPGELVSLLGPSGCGKSTLLRVIAGLERASAGSITIGNTLVDGDGQQRPPEQRHVGLVFQEFALFPHLTVAENVAFGLASSTAAKRTAEMLELVGLSDAGRRHPHELSGGEQQRIALARALAPAPTLLLLDEPFSGLDANRRERVREETRAILRAAGTASVLVTHDGEEAMQLGDRLALLRDGEIVQSGPGDDLFFNPVDTFTATFFGHADVRTARAEGGAVATPFGPVPAPVADGPVDLVVRHAALQLVDVSATPVTLRSSRLVGAQRLGLVAVGGDETPWTLQLDPLARAEPGQTLRAVLRPELVHIFPAG